MEKFRKKIFKSTKGITLIALVVTIIILLLLAGVSIAMLTGNNGVLTQGQRAKEETRIAGVEEVVKLYKQGKYIDSTTGSVTENANEMLENLKGQKLVSEDEIDRENEIITIKRKDGSIAKEIQYGMVTITISKTPENEKVSRVTLKVESVEGTKIPTIRNDEDFFNFINNLSDDEKKDLIRSMYPNFVNKMTQNSSNPTNFKTLNEVINDMVNNNEISENSEGAFWNYIEQNEGMDNCLGNCLYELCFDEEKEVMNGYIITNPYGENSDTYKAMSNGTYLFIITDIVTGREYKRNVNVDNTLCDTPPTLSDMYEKAIEDNCTNSDGSCTGTEHLHIGDYVDFENPKTGSIEISTSDSGMDNAELRGITAQTFEISRTNNKNQLNWRVLGKNENGEIELIAGNPMKSNNTINGNENPYLYLYGAKAYENGEKILNNICKLYKENDETGYISSSRSVNQEDINKVVGLKNLDEIEEVNLTYSIGTEYNFSDQYTPTSWLNGKTKTLVTGKSEAYLYSVNSKPWASAPFVTVSNRIFKMLFENTRYKRNTLGGRKYWLASKSILSDSNSVDFCINSVYYISTYEKAFSTMFCSDGSEECEGFGVRPVISLKSNVTNIQVPKIADKTEEIWNVQTGEPE